MDSTKSIDMSDVILVERKGELFKSSLANLQSLYLPKNQNDKIVELQAAIDELSSYIKTLSATIIEEYTPISELKEKYETKLSTDYMKENPNILDEDEIYKTLDEKNIVTMDILESSYTKDYDTCEREFDRLATKIGTSWFN